MRLPHEWQMKQVYWRVLGEDAALDPGAFAEAMRRMARVAPDLVAALAQALWVLVPVHRGDDRGGLAALTLLRVVCHLNEDDLFEVAQVAALVRDIAEGHTTDVGEIERRLHPFVRPWRRSSLSR